MPNIDPQKLEDRLDRVALGATEIDFKIGGIKFQTMIEVMEFAKLMALSDMAIPPHLRNNPGACLAVLTRALRFGFDPFALAEHSASMVSNKKEKYYEAVEGGRPIQRDRWVEESKIAYDSYVIRAIINAWAPIKGSIEYEYAGEGADRVCKVSAELLTGKTVTHQSMKFGDRFAKLPKSDDGKVRGSPLWTTKPDQQLGYDTARDFCRLYFPEVLMGWYDRDEIEEARAAMATDVTPRTESETTERLKGRLHGAAGGKGFDPGNIDRALEHRPGETVPEAKPEAERVVVTGEIRTPEPKKRSHHRKEPSNETAKSNTVGAGDGGRAGEASAPGPAVADNAGTADQPVGGEEAGREEPPPPEETIVNEQEPEQTASEAYAIEMLAKIEAHLASGEVKNVDELKVYKADTRKLVDALEGLSPDYMDLVRGQFSTMMLGAERALAKKKGGKR